MTLRVSSTKLDKLVEDPANPRSHDRRNLDAIKGSLEQFGQVEPLVVQRSTGLVVGGNGRLAAMRELGWTKAQTVLVDLDDTQARALSVTLNRTGELAGWDSANLQSAIDSVVAAGVDMSKLGWERTELEALSGQFDVNPIEMPGLATDDERQPLEQITFTLSNDQAVTVRTAVEAVKGDLPEDGVNKNANGNAIAAICKAFLAKGKSRG